MVILLFVQSSAGCVYSKEINLASTYEGTSQIVPLLVRAGQTDEMNEGTEYLFVSLDFAHSSLLVFHEKNKMKQSTSPVTSLYLFMGDLTFLL